MHIVGADNWSNVALTLAHEEMTKARQIQRMEHLNTRYVPTLIRIIPMKRGSVKKQV